MAEINGLMQGLMSSDEVPNGQTRFSDWVVENCDALGFIKMTSIQPHRSGRPTLDIFVVLSSLMKRVSGARHWSHRM